MQSIIVLGAAESGIGAAILAKKLNFEVFVSDSQAIKPKFKDELLHYNIAFEENGHSETWLKSGITVIKSPGIPEKAPIIQKLYSNQIEVISEIEFAYRHRNSDNIIAISGSNGKTTTTLLVYHLMRQAGFDIGLCGNVGFSFAKMIAEDPHQWYVVEVSSFQLDNCFSFQPKIAVLTNITENHLDRYNYDFSKYAEAKARLYQAMGPADFLIYSLDSKKLVDIVKKNKPLCITFGFSLSYTPDSTAWIDGDFLMFKYMKQDTDPKSEKLSVDKISTKHVKINKGKHNQQNLLAAGIVGNISGIRNDQIRESFNSFENEPHRLELVAEIDKVIFINDSKATTINAVWYALDSITQPVVWIVGGVDKGNDYGQLLDLVSKKVKAIVVLAKNKAAIFDAFATLKPIVHVLSMEDAIQESIKFAAEGDTILLSPACASFDLFEDYNARGDAFKNITLAILKEKNDQG